MMRKFGKKWMILLFGLLMMLSLTATGISIAAEVTPGSAETIGSSHIIEVKLKTSQADAYTGVHFSPFGEGGAVMHFEKGDVLAYSAYSPYVYSNSPIVLNRVGFNATMNLAGNGHMAMFASDQYGINISGVNDGAFNDQNDQKNVRTYMNNGWFERLIPIPEPFYGTMLRRFDMYLQFSFAGTNEFLIYIKDLRLIRADGSVQYFNEDDWGDKPQLLQDSAFSKENVDTTSSGFLSCRWLEPDAIQVGTISDYELPETAVVEDPINLPETLQGTYYDGTSFTLIPGHCAVILPDGSTSWGPTATFEQAGVYEFRYESGVKPDDDSIFNRSMRRLKFVTVYPKGAPVFEAPEIPDAQLGNRVTLPAFPQIAGDGIDKTVSLKDPSGKAVALDGMTFVPQEAGRYEAVYCAEKEGVSVERTAKFYVNNGTDRVLRVTVSTCDVVARRYHSDASMVDSMSSADFKKAVDFKVFPGADGVALKKGDKLVYEVYSPNAGEGVGTLSFTLRSSCFGSGTPEELDTLCSGAELMDTLFDQYGDGAGRATDLSGRITSGWYRREIALPDVFTSNGNLSIEDAVIDCLNIQTESFASYSEDLQIYFRNIKIVSADGSEYDFLSGKGDVVTQMASLYAPRDTMNQWGCLYYADWSVDPLPKFEGTLVDSVEKGDVVELGTFKIVDSTTGESLDFDEIVREIKVYCQEEEVAVQDNKFTAEMGGDYTVELYYTYAEKDLVQRFLIKGFDDEPPVVTLNGTYPQKGKVGDKIDLLQVTATDNVTANPLVTVTVTDPDSQQVNIQNGYFRLEKEGIYLIRYEAKDAAGKVGFLECRIECEQAESAAGEGGCGGCKSARAGFLAVILLTAAVVIGKVR